MSSSRLNEIWQSYTDQWQRLDDLERNMEEAVVRKRRRIANLLDEMPSFRKSHLRLFISHRIINSIEQSYEIIVEGKLLVGHLDHKRAKEVDDALFGGLVNPEVDPTDRSQYRGGISERESDTPVEPIHFTHLLDQFKAIIYTVWQPSQADSKTPLKRSKGKRQSPAAAFDTPIQSSPKTILAWSRVPDSTNPNIATSPDSHGFILPYTCPKPPAEDLIFHSIIVELQLWLRPGDSVLYQPSINLCKALFPQHSISPSKKRIRKEMNFGVPTENELFVPSLLTMEEIVMAFFHYIQFKKLQDSEEKSIIICDKTLQTLLECERFNFADLQFFLTNKNLIADATKEPCSFTYIVGQDYGHPGLTIDLDVYVPSLFHYRCRELLRRLKQREFEYTSSRTKARNWLMTGRASEDKVRQVLDDCVTGQGFTKDHICGWLALARAAPEGSEARNVALLDVRICFLLDRAEQHAKAAKAAWDVVTNCQPSTSN